MKKKNTLILMFLAVFIAVTFMGFTEAKAAAVAECGNPELSDKLCFAVYDTVYTNIQIWVARAVDINGESIKKADLGTKWPYLDPDGSGNYVFRYEAGTTQAAIDADKSKDPYYDDFSKPSAVSYIWFSLPNPPIDSVPSGANTEISLIGKDCEVSSIGDRIAWKLNPNITFGKVASFELHYPPGTGVDTKCGKLGIIWSSLCEMDTIVAPLGSGLPPQDTISYTCFDKIKIEVKFDECTLEPDVVKCINTINNIESDAREILNPFGVFKNPEDETLFEVFPIEKMGPKNPGCFVCTDKKPMYFRGDKAWLCD